uniref:Uncharacterized protein n=1 Tax=Oryza meridionalis TaxID=40149 RepID=A0A0E0CYQ1_9ORYZ
MALVAAAAANQKQQKASIGRRAWRLLHLAVLWARKGSAVHSLCLFSNLRCTGVGLGIVGGGGRSEHLRYGEPEYSIEETPSARVLRLIPCIAPTVPDMPRFYGDEDHYFFCRWDTEPECSGVGCYDYIENDVLKTEQIVQVVRPTDQLDAEKCRIFGDGHGARGDVTILPTLVINNVQYRAANQKQQKASIGRRAWRLLHLAVLWARKGSAVHSLCLFSNLRCTGVGLGIVGGGGRSEHLRYGEPEYSIEETPSARVLRLIPCIAPTVPDMPRFYGDEDHYFFCRWDTEPECSGVGCYDYIENDVLKTEQIVQVVRPTDQLDAEKCRIFGDVTILPTLVINNVQYRDLFCYDYNGEPSECGSVEDESFRDGAMDEQLLELSMPTPASARHSAR